MMTTLNRRTTSTDITTIFDTIFYYRGKKKKKTFRAYNENVLLKIIITRP